MTFAIIAITIIVISALLAKYKERSVGLAIVSAVFFGIFTIIYYLIVSKLKECPKCKMKVKETALTCYHCGHSFVKKTQNNK